MLTCFRSFKALEDTFCDYDNVELSEDYNDQYQYSIKVFIDADECFTFHKV